MIDTGAIFFSTLMCLVVVFRAIKLDGQLPWFGVRPRRGGPWDARGRGGAGGGADAGADADGNMSDVP